MRETFFTIGQDVETLARVAGVALSEDIDDLGPLRYFRFNVPASPAVEIEVYAHDDQPGPGVHVLSSAPDDLDATALALRYLGVEAEAVFSAIDPDGANIADLEGMRSRLAIEHKTKPTFQQRLQALTHAVFHRD